MVFDRRLSVGFSCQRGVTSLKYGEGAGRGACFIDSEQVDNIATLTWGLGNLSLSLHDHLTVECKAG